ncbi:unnamed protein product [Rotaria magnacalcarata]|uniref:Uncharacterized protein n=1 Tax=Rotaria magnacalcarata TaxID=392030 RepID=A0A816XI97_9BILA|nr:unnamed protein product [Rotaria magnacalcarata]CAF4302987.1 unnamed protein product [Rotaria magnacalcarata]
MDFNKKIICPEGMEEVEVFMETDGSQKNALARAAPLSLEAGQLSQDPGLDMVPILEGPDQEPPPGVILNLIRKGQEVALVQDLNPLLEGLNDYNQGYLEI